MFLQPRVTSDALLHDTGLSALRIQTIGERRVLYLQTIGIRR